MNHTRLGVTHGIRLGHDLVRKCYLQLPLPLRQEGLGWDIEDIDIAHGEGAPPPAVLDVAQDGDQDGGVGDRDELSDDWLEEALAWEMSFGDLAATGGVTEGDRSLNSDPGKTQAPAAAAHGASPTPAEDSHAVVASVPADTGAIQMVEAVDEAEQEEQRVLKKGK